MGNLGKIGLLVVGAVATAVVWGLAIQNINQVPTAARSSEPVVARNASADKEAALFFGDSYFNGSEYTTAVTSMAYLAGTALGYEYPVVSGAGGTGFVAANRAAKIPNYMGQVDAGAWAELTWEPSLVVIEGGLNDRGSPPEKITGRAVDLLVAAEARFDGARVVLVGPVDTDGDYSDTGPVTAALEAAAQEADVPFVDASGWLEGNYDLLGKDGLHPTPEGHELLAKRLAAALR